MIRCVATLPVRMLVRVHEVLMQSLVAGGDAAVERAHKARRHPTEDLSAELHDIHRTHTPGSQVPSFI